MVELQTEGLQVQILFVAQVGHGELADAVEIVLVSRSGEFTVVGTNRLLRHEVGGDIDDVVALVSFVRPARVAGFQTIDARLDRLHQLVDLHACVVVIELARDAPTLGGEEAAHRIAQRRLARVAQVQRAGGVGGNEFDQYTLAVGRLQAEALACLQHLGHHRLLGGGRQTQVDEAGAGDFERADPALHRGLALQGRDELLGHRARVALGGARHRHRGGNRQVAMRGLLGRLEGEREAVPGSRLLGGLAQGVEQRLLGLDHGDDSTVALCGRPVCPGVASACAALRFEAEN